MTNVFSILPAISPLLLFAVGLIPDIWANRHVVVIRNLIMTIAYSACCLSIATAVLLALNGPLDVVYFKMSWPVPIGLGIYIDRVAIVMLTLISFIGLVISRYSLRYLDGEATQGRFLRWISFTLGAVMLMVISRNLVMFTAAWMLTSFGLHQLLTHYPDRSWAIWAARKKFLVSRLGDLMLLFALGLTFWQFGSSEYTDLFAVMKESANETTLLVTLIGVFLALGALSKSAQFPFHTWLPDTMETPTPVSALMHAGIINAGGFLVIRLSPLISHSRPALDLLALVGGFTALFGSVVMLTQTSIKRSLAYSTIAQMGFMMLQCGLGAYSAAMLHIVAHSLYKAYSFLSCGSVLESAARLRTDSGPAPTLLRRLVVLPIATAVAIGLCAAPVWLMHIDQQTKSGAAVLGVVLNIALIQMLWNSFSIGSWRVAVRSLFAGALVTFSYYAAFLVMNNILAETVPHLSTPPSSMDTLVFGLVALGFGFICILQSIFIPLTELPLVRALYVHAMNGLYLDIPARRLTARFWGQSAPAQ
ncbi:MAG: proton-conducting transporter membrane subunit [Schlesneria sp.]